MHLLALLATVSSGGLDWFIHEQAVDQIFKSLCEAYDHVNVYEVQQDFESAIFDLTRDRGESLLDFINKAIAAFAKSFSTVLKTTVADMLLCVLYIMYAFEVSLRISVFYVMVSRNEVY